MRTCIVCHKPAGEGHLRYCSDECAEAIKTKPRLAARMKELGIIGYVTVTKCGVCGKESTRGSYCSRTCELVQQRRSFGGLTLREWAKKDGAA